MNATMTTSLILITAALIGCHKTKDAGIPSLPAGVTELNFSEFFVSPIGDRGLTFTDKLRSLDGKRVRITGYMVEQEKPTPGVFPLAAVPIRLHEDHYGLADDLPPATAYVSMPTDYHGTVPHTRELMLVTGILRLGNREETDGRISTVRLTVDQTNPILLLHKRAAAESHGPSHARNLSLSAKTAERSVR
jgi:hypothetical protein